MFYQEETTNIWNLYQKCQLVMWVDHLFPLQFARNGKQTISYRSVQKLDGNKPPIVFLHGIGSGSGSWAPIMSLLKEQYLPIAWDAPGYNKSTHLTKQNPQSIDYSQTLLDFTKLLNLQPYAVIGHSLGALMAVCYAINHLPNLPKLILANPANGYGNEKNAYITCIYFCSCLMFKHTRAGNRRNENPSIAEKCNRGIKQRKDIC